MHGSRRQWRMPLVKPKDHGAPAGVTADQGNSVAIIPAIMAVVVTPAGESGMPISVPAGIERAAWKSRLIFPGPPLLLSIDCSSASLSSLASSLRCTVFVLR
jgi:hypothetical protein